MSGVVAADAVRKPVLKTVQFAWGGLFDAEPVGPIHLVLRNVEPFDPATLCGLAMFGERDTPGWSLGGGVSGHGNQLAACVACGQKAQQVAAPDVGVWGSVGGDLFTGNRRRAGRAESSRAGDAT